MKSFAVIGLGRFGETVALNLAADGHQVMVIDSDPAIVNVIADSVTNAVVGDPTSETVLKAAGIKDYDCAIVCIAGNVNDSVLITLTLKDLGVPKIIARANNERHKLVLERLGADMVVFPEQDMGEKLANILSKKNVRDYIELYDGYSIVEIEVPAKWIGKSITEIHVRRKFGVDIIAIRNIKENKTTVSPHPDTVFREGDTVSIVGSKEDIDRITASF